MPMPSNQLESTEEAAKQGALQYAKAWGGKPTAQIHHSILSRSSNISPSENPLPPTLLATLVFAQHARPFQTLPMLFPPILLFSSYLNVQGFKTDSAGLTSAWSAAYLVLARRRKQAFGSKFGARGLVRGATVGLCLANVAGGGLAYAFGRKRED